MKKFAAFALVASLLVVLGLAGCASAPTPSSITGKALDALKAQDYETLQTCYSGDVGGTDVKELAGQMTGMDLSAVTDEQKAQAEKLVSVLTDFDYTIGEETIDGDKATVEVTITSRDLGPVFSDAIGAYFTEAFTSALGGASEEELAQMFLDTLTEKISAQTEKSHTATTTFNLTQTDGEWKLDQFSTDNLDCIMGGMLSGVEETMGNIQSLLGGATDSTAAAA